MDDASHPADAMIRAVHAVSVMSLFSLDRKQRRHVCDQGHRRGTTEIEDGALAEQPVQSVDESGSAE